MNSASSPHAPPTTDPSGSSHSWSEQTLLLAQRLARLGTWEWRPTEDVVLQSRLSAEIQGLDPDRPSTTLDEFLAPIHPDDRDRVESALRGALERAVSFGLEYRVRRPDDRIAHVIGRGEPAVPHHADGADDADGAAETAPPVLLGTVQDITEQKESAQRELSLIREQVARARAEEERRFLERIFLNLPALVAITRGPNHELELANPAFQKALGLGPDDSGPLRALISEIELERDGEQVDLIRVLDRVFESGEPLEDSELLLGHPNGAGDVGGGGEGGDDDYHSGRFNLVFRPLIRADGTTGRILVTGVDVTQQVESREEVEEKADALARMTAELEQRNAELDQFAYVASHDLKAPLRGIANLSQWIQEDLTEELGKELPEETLEHLELLRGRVHRMEALIEGLLSYSRAGRVKNDPESIDTGELVREVIDLLGPREGIEVAVGDGFPTLHTERLPLQQVFHNLIGNALKFGASRVEVSAETGPRSTLFSVADDGPGIPAEYERKIWIMFQTLQARDEIEGTGMGLALVKKIVESRGGEVWVESEPGEGADFRFRWPHREPEPRA